jgi:ribose 5-phosphate isomerase B
MRLAIASDHAGFELKSHMLRLLQEGGHELLDCGTHSTDPVDYPDFAVRLGETVLRQDAERGILICGSGVGAAVAANKLPGIRAAVCHDTYSARQGVEHDDLNVLCLGARIIGSELARELVLSFLQARFSGDARHVKRLEKIAELERRACGSSPV